MKKKNLYRMSVTRAGPKQLMGDKRPTWKKPKKIRDCYWLWVVFPDGESGDEVYLLMP